MLRMDSLSRMYASVNTGVETHEGATVSVAPRSNTAVASRRAMGSVKLLERKVGVVDVADLGRGRWSITFDDGTVWNVSDQAQPCGSCG